MSGIPEKVLQFIAEKIDTVPQLETLLLVREEPDRGWSEEEIAARIYVAPAMARNILEILSQRHLLIHEGMPPRFRYSPSAESAALIAQVAVAYRSHLVSMTTFIHSMAPASVREFARAFDLKKDR